MRSGPEGPSPPGDPASPCPLGRPRLHLRATTSTNDRARELAMAGAPHGTLVTAAEQTAGRGRQGRVWAAPPGSALLASLVLRRPAGTAPDELLSLRAGVAACDAIDAIAAAGATDGAEGARIKWPNDIVTGERLAKLGGILVEGRPHEGWAVIGIGLNVAVTIEQLPAELRHTAATLGLAASEIEPLLGALLAALERRLAQPVERVLNAWRERDALHGRRVSWTAGAGVAEGVAEGVDGEGRLLVRRADGCLAALDAGEVHLASAG
jgi:BirA family biotin operon repressor/biotin-[acetyl-CoA-carboxylase] ligase